MSRSAPIKLTTDLMFDRVRLHSTGIFAPNRANVFCELGKGRRPNPTLFEPRYNNNRANNVKRKQQFSVTKD